MFNVVTWDEWVVLFMACLFVGGSMVVNPLGGLPLLVPLVVRGCRLARRAWS